MRESQLSSAVDPPAQRRSGCGALHRKELKVHEKRVHCSGLTRCRAPRPGSRRLEPSGIRLPATTTAPYYRPTLMAIMQRSTSEGGHEHLVSSFRRSSRRSHAARVRAGPRGLRAAPQSEDDDRRTQRADRASAPTPRSSSSGDRRSGIRMEACSASSMTSGTCWPTCGWANTQWCRCRQARTSSLRSTGHRAWDTPGVRVRCKPLSAVDGSTPFARPSIPACRSICPGRRSPMSSTASESSCSASRRRSTVRSGAGHAASRHDARRSVRGARNPPSSTPHGEAIRPSSWAMLGSPMARFGRRRGTSSGRTTGRTGFRSNP